MLNEPAAGDLAEVVHALRDWQREGMPIQLHPGDLGWHWSFGATATATAVRTWQRDGQLLAVGLLDGPGLLRLAIAPAAEHDEELARQLVTDLNRPEAGVLPAGPVAVEARFGQLFRGLLAATGWDEGEPWTPLVRALEEAVPGCGLRVELVGPDQVGDRVAAQRASFDGSKFTEQRWQAMAGGPAYADARCLLGYDGAGTAVAIATVWSAGSGRPGLLEPVGVHRDHRGHGYGTAISVAAAAVLAGMGASSATVCTPSANVGAVATYRSAGFEELPQVRDLQRSS